MGMAFLPALSARRGGVNDCVGFTERYATLVTTMKQSRHSLACTECRDLVGQPQLVPAQDEKLPKVLTVCAAVGHGHKVVVHAKDVGRAGGAHGGWRRLPDG